MVTSPLSPRVVTPPPLLAVLPPLLATTQMPPLSPRAAQGQERLRLLLPYCFFRRVIVQAFFQAVREEERSGMARILIKPGPTKHTFMGRTVFLTGRMFPVRNIVFRARNSLNERGLSRFCLFSTLPLLIALLLYDSLLPNSGSNTTNKLQLQQGLHDDIYLNLGEPEEKPFHLTNAHTSNGNPLFS
jgi:hypothetical protein